MGHRNTQWMWRSLIFLLHCFGASVRGQTLGPDIVAGVGDNVTFSFSLPQSLVFDFPVLVIFNNRNDPQDVMYIRVSNNSVLPNTPNFHGQASYQGNVTARQISFLLRDVTTANAGLYTCGRISVTDIISNCGQKLVIQGRPTQPVISPSSPVTAVESRDVTLTCSSNATTLPVADRLPLSYSWYRGGNPVSGGTGGSLVVSPVRRADEGNYTCRSREGSDRMTSELSAPVFLDVAYGPSIVTLAPPDVYHEVRETTGAVPDIQCQADCDPPCDFRWRDRGGNPVGSTGSRLQLTNITRDQSGNFTCTASNQHGSSNVSVAIFATYPPEVRVLMSGCAVATSYVTVVDSSVTLTCDVTGAYPSTISAYEWSMNGSGWQTGGRQQQLTVTRSSGGQYACRATNSVDRSVPASVTVDVQYAPVLTLSSTSVAVVEGGALEVECGVEARPDVTALRWSRVSGSLPPTTNLSLPRLSLSHVTRNLSGLYVCSATNRLSPCDVSAGGERTVSANVSVDVQYPPDVRVQMSGCTANATYVTVVDSSVTLTCDVTDANPSTISVYEWWVPGSDWQTGGRQWQLTVTRSSGGQYACRATNSVGRSVPASLTVDVHYAPVLTLSSTWVTVVEGGALEVECGVEARPNVTALRWSRVSGSLPPTTNLSLPRLSLSHVTRNLSGLYVCSATNRLSPCDVSAGGERTVSANVSVDVQYGPEVTLLSVNSLRQSATVEEKAEWSLGCDVSSNPRSLLRLLNDSDAAVLAELPHTLSLQRSWPAHCLHTGNYSCSASNSVAMVTSSSPVQLFVTCSPRQDFRVPNTQTTLASRIGDTVTFTLPLVALPSPQHLWYRLANSSGSGQQVLNTSASRYGLTASLTLTNVQQSDFGIYFLDASNNVSTTTFNFTLFAADRPECPTLMDVKPLDAKVNISWERGFNNGGPQHFRVEEREGRGTWRNSSPSVVAEAALQDRYSLTLDLQPGRDYVLRVRAYNQYGHSLCEEEGTAVRIKESSNTSALIGGVAGSSSCVIIVVIIGVVVVRKRRAAKKSDYADRDRTELGNELSTVTACNKTTSPKTSSAILEDNILYESSNGLQAGASAPVHPILEDNPLYESSTASATAQGKSNQKSKETQGPSDESNVYAQVVKKKTSAANEKKKGGKNTKRGDVYENVELANSKVAENVYANSANTCDSSDKAALVTNQTAEPEGPVREIDNDGCVYMTVENTGAPLKKPEKSAKPAIAPKPQNGAHAYQDDSVIYSDIDHSKKAPSLEGPDDSAQK